MNRQDIIHLAKKVRFEECWSLAMSEKFFDRLEDFAALVAAAEREKWQWDDIHSCHPHCDRPACIAVRRAREDEREACVKVVQEWLHGDWHNAGVVAVTMIRERGAP